MRQNAQGRILRYALILAVLAGLATQAKARASVAIQVQSVGGGPVPNELVIVQDLDAPYGEMLRALSDKNGDVPMINLKPGLYRAIATTPYGLWYTAVREFLVNDRQTEVKVVVTAEAMGTQDWITVRSPSAEPGRSAEIHVLTADGGPASGARILTRDKDITPYLQNFYKTDAKGWVSIDLIAKPTVVVIIYGDVLVTREISDERPAVIVHLPEK